MEIFNRKHDQSARCPAKNDKFLDSERRQSQWPIQGWPWILLTSSMAFSIAMFEGYLLPISGTRQRTQCLAGYKTHHYWYHFMANNSMKLSQYPQFVTWVCLKIRYSNPKFHGQSYFVTSQLTKKGEFTPFSDKLMSYGCNVGPPVMFVGL